MQRVVTFRNFTIAVGLCLATSACLAFAPFVSPGIPLFPFIAANWGMWFVVAVVFRRSKAEWVTYAQSVWWVRLTSLALVSFTAAGFFALYHSESMFRAGDLAQLR